MWLRIDWNGHGFDAFVTDVNLGRTRVSVRLPEIPKPDQWVHLALAWDETSGIRFYVGGKLKTKGTPYLSRPDLGIDPEDVKVASSKMTVTVHSLGGADAPGSNVVVRDRNGKTIATADVPALKAPLDLTPKTAEVTLAIPSGHALKGDTVTVECGGDIPEITLMNNSVTM